MTNKQERIIALRDSIHGQISYGEGMGDAIRAIVDGFTNMLLVLAEDDHEEIAKRMVRALLFKRMLKADIDYYGKELPRE